MTKQKTVEDRFKKLSEIEHVLKRPGRYIGAITADPITTYTISNGAVEWREVSYSPAFLKLFDEIISNSADFSKTAEGKHVNKIEVDIDATTGVISVLDNGGIPVVKHSEYEQYVPDMIFGELRSGSNFDDDADSVTTGQNGEGSTLTNIFSKSFIVDTSDGKNRFLCEYRNNLSERDTPKITKSTKKYTKITYLPDYEKLGVILDADNIRMLERRVYEIAATNTHLKVYLNGNMIDFKSFKDFVALFSDKSVSFSTDRYDISVFHSKDGFKQIGFVNSTNVFQGGTHVDAVMNSIVSGIREHIKKKTKQDIKPSDIKNHFFLMGTFTINNPRYSSQTKELLITPPKDYGMSIDIPAKVLQQIIKSDIVTEIIEWAENKKALDDLNALKKKNKDLDKNNGNVLRSITKYEPATSKIRHKCSLFVAEGDCLEENTTVVAYLDDGILAHVPLKDISVGDYVLTDKNRLRRVVNKTKKVVEGITFTFGGESITMSPEHKMVVYDKTRKRCVLLPAKEIDKSIHAFVRSRVVDFHTTSTITSVQPIDHEVFDYEVIHEMESDTPTYASASHRFLVWDAVSGSFAMKRTDELVVGTDSMVMVSE